MATKVRLGPFLHDLQAPAQTQAYYSIYPHRLFERAQVRHTLVVSRASSTGWR